MKTYIFKFTLFTSIILSVVAQAAPPSAELKVKGKLGVPSCTVIAPDGGIYDLGKISATNVKPGTVVTTLAPITKNWSIVCDAQTYLSFGSVDNRNASVSDTSSTSNHGLGFINGTGKIGYYTLIMSNPVVDGVQASVFSVSTSGGVSAGSQSFALATTGPLRAWSIAGTNTQIAGKVFSADFKVTPTLAGTTAMNGPITEDATIDGSVTMNFSFGI
ncbi:Beta-fimbriae probable major subunit [Yersinia enterocolitica]|nr:Beta-fimbriae probable major subunit [Yersinia enterocolitica]